MPHNAYLLKKEIIKRLGFFPSFFTPALKRPQILTSLYQQTLSSYINNPLANLFKEKLFINLSRYCQIDYFVICHSCTLRSLGITAKQILALDNFLVPQTEADLKPDFQVLEQQIKRTNSHNWSKDSQLENTILRCATLLFLQPYQAETCYLKLKQFLGITDYSYLILLLGYIKFCHQWLISHPEISYQQDRRAQLHLAPLLLEDIKLAEFFRKDNLNTRVNSAIARSSQIRETTPQKLDLVIQNQNLNRERFKMSFINAPFPIAIYENKGRILHVNKNWTEITGYDLVEIPTIEAWKKKAAVKQQEIVRSRKICWETESTFQKIVSSLFNLPQEYDCPRDLASSSAKDYEKKTCNATRSEVSIITSYGEKRFWELYAAPLALNNNGMDLTIAIAKDVTNFIHNEAKLAEAETRLKLVLEVTKTGSWDWNLETNQVKICHRARAILGLENLNNSYQGFLEVIHVAERESVDLAAVKAVQARKTLELEYRIVKPDNTIRWIKTKGKLNFDLSGKAIRLTGVVTDITEQKQLQQQLQDIQASQKVKSQSNEQLEIASDSCSTDRYKKQEVTKSLDELENLLNSIPYYLFVVDVKTKCISVCNLALAQSLGFVNSQQIQGKAIADCFPPENAHHIVLQQKQVLQSKSVLRIQEEIVLPDGNHYFDTVVTPLENAEGEIYALLYTSSDIPDLAAAQQALSERTAQLEAANKELESFSYSVSHDLQAPLRRINSFSEVLWEQYNPTLDERAKHYLQRIQANSKRMSDLIDALLQLSRITRSKMEYKTVNLSEIATDILNELQITNPQRKVELNIASGLETKGDPQLLRIVLNNLLDNAWKYTSKQAITCIEFNAIVDENNKNVYFVRDNGAGFDGHYINKLFKAFQRLHSETEFPGTGIGLATVQRIIYRHSGKVWAEAEPEQGATFYFSL